MRIHQEGRHPSGTAKNHNCVPAKATMCDGCHTAIHKDAPVLYDRRLKVVEEVTTKDGKLYYHERIGAYHNTTCKNRRRNALLGEAMRREASRPHP